MNYNNGIPNLTSAQQQALLRVAGEKLGINPAELEAAVKNGKFNSFGNASQVEKIANDPKALEKLLSDPKAQAVIKKVMGGI